jgi:hypothetical protein
LPKKEITISKTMMTQLLTTFGANFKQLCIERAVARTHNSTYPKGGVSCSKDSFVVKQTLVFQINFCGESPALRVAAKRQTV